MGCPGPVRSHRFGTASRFLGGARVDGGWVSLVLRGGFELRALAGKISEIFYEFFSSGIRCLGSQVY